MDCKNDFSNGDNFYVNSLSKQLIAPVRKNVTHLGGDCMTAAIKIVAYKSCSELSLSVHFWPEKSYNFKHPFIVLT
jgi:hypothetical protein